MRYRHIALSFIFALLVLASSVRADLEQYVQQPDDSYDYTVERVEQIGPITEHLVKMTSQTWRGIAWWHWLRIIVPQELRHPDQAILVIGGGSNRNRTPKSLADKRAMHLLGMLADAGAIVVVLEQVPNQPLFDGLSEDRLIAHTFDHFLSGGDDDWPLLLPMVKSAVRAMDTAQAVAKRDLKLNIERFIVSGGSKRGWTTWLTGAVDSRVKAIVPMVIDMPNIVPQMKHQMQTYGAYSEMIREYEERNVLGRIDTEIGHKLMQLVDPYSYRDRLTMPKLVLLGTNDPYWTVDAANFYFDDLPGEKHLYYLPNAGHGLGIGIVPTLVAFVRSVMDSAPLPRMQWQHDDDGTLTVTWDAANGRPVLWQARSTNRDFRKAQWLSQPLDGKQQCQVRPDPPADGWLAYYVEVQFPSPRGMPYGLTTTITVLPDTFPNHDPPASP